VFTYPARGAKGQGKFCQYQVAAGRTIRIIPNADEMGSIGILRQLDFEDDGRWKPPQKDGSLSAKPSTSAPATISSACDFELGLDLTAFRTVFSVAQLSPEFFDLDC